MKSHFVSLPELPPEEQQRLLELKDRLKYKIIDINVKIGDKVSYNQVLASYGVYFIKTEKEVRVWTDKIKSIKCGKIKRVSINKSSKVRPGENLMIIEYCPHEMEFNGLCAYCGIDITLVHTASIQRKSEHIIFGNQPSRRKIVKLTSSALCKIRDSNTFHLQSSCKLALVLDIDHTFLHATRDPQAKLVYNHHDFKDSTHSFILPGHRSPYYIKIRPGFRSFLLDVAGAYDIHLYTMSMRKYAEEIVKWIENPPISSNCINPNKYKSLIQNLVTRDDVPSNKKLLNRLFPCDQRMVIIIDDRIDVWPNAMQNVIQIHKYLFWPNTEEDIIYNNDNDIDNINNYSIQRQLGSTQIILEKKIKSKRKNEIQRGLKRFITNFFKELGCYKINIQSDIIYIFTHKSPDDNKLKRFSNAIKEALQHEIPTNDDKSYLFVLRGCKISYKINSNELKRREGDRVLSCLSSVLLKIHKNYYQQYENHNDNDNNNDKNIYSKKIRKIKMNRKFKEKQKKNKKIIQCEEKTNNNNNNNDNNKEEMNPDIKKKSVDARDILKLVKREVFDGYTFVFSGVFPVDINPSNTSEWKRAIEFGAKCVGTLTLLNNEGVTHCIALRMGTNKVSIALKLGLEIVHPNWLHNSTTHYMESNPSIYRPQGWDQKKHGNKNENEKKNGIKSILIGNKRKRNNHNQFDENNQPKQKKIKTVKFKGIHNDDIDIDNDIDIDIDPDTKIMNSLSEFVTDFNKNKDLMFKGTEKDIIIKEKENGIIINIEKEKEKKKENNNNNNNNNNKDKGDYDNFDFEDIHKNINNAMQENKNKNNNDNHIKNGGNHRDYDDIELKGSDYYPSNTSNNNNNNINNDDDEEEEEDNDINLEDMLDSELESLSS